MLTNPWIWGAVALLLIVTFWDKVKPTWRPGPVDPVTPAKPVKPTVADTLTVEAKEFIEARNKLDAAIVAEKAAAEADAKAHAENVAKLEADKRTAEQLIIVGEKKPEVPA